MTLERKWRPLHVAIAWALTRDEEFCCEIAGDKNAEHYTFFASERLEQAMIQAGCFDIIQGPKVMLRHTLKPGYAGRFRSLAEEYENGGKTTFTAAIKAVPHAPEAAAGSVPLLDFLSGRWGEAFRSIADRIADGDIRARGVAIDGEERLPSGDMPPASVTNAMRMEDEYTVWEGPKARGQQPRRWIGITLEWNGLIKCFPKPRAPTKNEKKRAAAFKAIEAIGIEKLKLLSQKEREALIIARVHTDDQLSVSFRFVRDCFTKARS